MFCSRCVLPFLAFYLCMEEVPGAALSSGTRTRTRREVDWMDQDLMERGDLSVGDAGDVGLRHDFISPTEHQNQNQNQNQYQRKNNEKRRKVVRLDTIGSFQMSNIRNRKDEPTVDVDDHRP